MFVSIFARISKTYWFRERAKKEFQSFPPLNIMRDKLNITIHSLGRDQLFIKTSERTNGFLSSTTTTMHGQLEIMPVPISITIMSTMVTGFGRCFAPKKFFKKINARCLGTPSIQKRKIRFFYSKVRKIFIRRF